ECTSVRRGGLRSLCGAACLDNDDWLVKCNLTSSRDKGTSVADRLHVQHNAAGVWIVTKVIDQIAPAHIEHGADRNEGAKADVLLQTPIENRGTERTTLADKRYITWSGNRACKGGVQTTSWVHQAQTVGAD